MKNKKKAEIQNIYAMTPMQKGILFHWMLDKDSQAYTEQLSFTIKGNLDVKLLEKSLNILIRRYDIFRTIFNYEKSAEPIQVVLKERMTTIKFANILHMDFCEKNNFLKNYYEYSLNKRFDLSKDVLIRIAVIQIEETEYKVVWNHHHIIMDGWCLGIVSKELFQIYIALKNDAPINLPPTTPFSTYIKWIEQQNKEASGSYWGNCLEGYNNQVILPSALKSKPLNTFEARENQFVIDAHISKRLLQIAVHNNITVNTIIQTMWGILLQKYNDVNDVVFGTVVSGRPPEIPMIDTMIGLFINTITVRIRSEKEDTFANLLQKTNEYIISSRTHQHFPLYEIQSNTLQKQGLINHIIVFENYPIDKEVASLEWEGKIGFSLSDVKMLEQTNYDFTVTVLPGDTLTIKFSYNSRVFDEKEVKAIERHFIKIVDTIVENPNVLIEEIVLISKKEHHQLVVGFNDTAALYPKDITIHQLFEQQVRQSPEKIAVVYEGSSFTYKELNERSNQLARVLRSKGVKPDSLVAIMVERSIDMIVGIIGALKAGGAYLPIDPGLPENRIEYMIGNSGAKILLTQTELMEKAICSAEIIDVKNDAIYEGDSTNLDNRNSPNDLAYIVYTSGTTGQPKGVMIEHSSWVNAAFAWREAYELDRFPIRLLQMASFSFDVFAGDLARALLSGGTLVICPNETKLELASLHQMILSHNINIFESTPALIVPLMRYIADFSLDISCLRLLILGSDNCPAADFRWLAEQFGRQMRILNSYGVTEACIDTSFYEAGASIKESADFSIVPIGKPLPNMKLYIVNSLLQPQPVGVPGELYISGAGVARGYFNQPELTAKKFIASPFVSGERLYRTGDMAKWLPDGNAQFLGRNDDQMKIRGYRIEPGEIEACLSKHEGLRESVVVVREDGGGEAALCVYFVADDSVTVQSLRDHLLDRLPPYMVPSYFMRVIELPLTSNGKIDRNALPKPAKIILNHSNKYPENDIEKTLVQVWEDVLGLNSLGTEDNFFYLGGDSIKAIQVSSRLLKQGYRMEIRELFENPTIKELSRHVKIAHRKISQAAVEGTVKLTPIQRWFFEENVTDKHHWNQAVMLQKKDGFDAAILEELFSKIVEHHDALRMKYETGEEGIVQKIKGINELPLFSMEIYDIMHEHKNDAGFILDKANQLQNSINLGQGPLLKAALFKTAEGDHLLIVIHHLVVDGVSWRILMEDFNSGYTQALQNKKIQLQDKTDSFKVWADKLHLFANQKISEKEVEYWSNMDRKCVPALPKDRAAKVRMVKNSHTVSMSLSLEHTTALLKEVNQAYNTSIDDILLTALVLVNKQWTGENRLLLELEGHGRQEILEDVDISRTVGWFTSNYPIVLEVQDESDLPSQIKLVKETLREIPNKGIGYSIIKYLTEQNDPGRIAFQLKPEIQFNYLGQFDQDMRKELFQLSPLSVGQNVSSNSEISSSISINGFIEGGIFQCSFTYCKDEYDEITMLNLIERYKTQLEQLISHCTVKDTTELTPSDLSSTGISKTDLDEIYMLVEKKSTK